MQPRIGRGIWLASLGISRRPTLACGTSARARFAHSSSRFTKESPRWFRCSLFLATPVAGAAVLLFPRETSPVPLILSSPKAIPCTSFATKDASYATHQMSSPQEQRQSVMRKILLFIKFKIWEPILIARRFIHLTFLFVPVFLTIPIILFGPRQGKHNGRRGALVWYAFLTHQMQRAGPTFIKFAQWAATRQDLFPAEMCERLGQLHSAGEPHSLRHTKRVIERVFKRPFDEVFVSFDEKPIGVGAIGQVYCATLNPDLIPAHYLSPKHSKERQEWPRALANASRVLVSPDVPPPVIPSTSIAIKVLHPGVADMIRRDLAIMSFFAKCLSIIPGIEWLSLSDEVQVFGTMMNEQLDLTHEASNLRQFEKNFADKRAAVTFPRPLEEFTSADVLVEEHQNALPLKAFLENGGGPYDHRLADLGLDVFLNMLLIDNFVHSDLHPGNIMIKFYKPTTTYIYKNILHSILYARRPQNDDLHPTSIHQSRNDEGLTPSEESDQVIERLRPLECNREAWKAELEKISKEGYLPALVLIDAGLVTTLNQTNRRNFLDLFRAIAEFNGYHAGVLMIERCRTPELAIDTETFALKMQHLVLGVKSKTFSLGKIKISDVLTQVLINVRDHHVRMEGDFINTVLAVLLLEGIGRQLDPNMDLFKSALPILRQLGSQMTTRDAMNEIPKGNFGAMLKFWVWIEARELVSSALVNIDEMVKYDWLSPNI
ncbi:protein kinase [Cantharellus anzutake]|uniref:protein kinase n=1 Tax=Cantharellus anzutake TaxID=1750568 RepID=UPI001907A120|nr:protein kinase [Cantharellus anzutake]KAF8330430.1 protein kinase [Cantharellus anzutake]